MFPIPHHFLFNVLNAVSSLMYSDVDAANDMLVLLGSFLREVLGNNQERLSTVTREVEIARMYSQLESMRFGDRLRITWEVPPSVHQMLVPHLVLQPLIESAIRNGVERGGTGGGIEVRVHATDGVVCVTVFDTGSWTADALSARAEEPGLVALAERLRARDEHPPKWRAFQGRGVEVSMSLRR